MTNDHSSFASEEKSLLYEAKEQSGRVDIVNQGKLCRFDAPRKLSFLLRIDPESGKIDIVNQLKYTLHM